MMGSIIVGGAAWPCGLPVVPWDESGMYFAAATRTRAATRWIVNHWTGSENTARDVWRNMSTHRDRTGKLQPLSVHFIIDQLGVIYQCSDAETRCAHAPDLGGNSYGVGIELINRGHGLRLPAKGFRRELRTETIHRANVTYGAFFEPQIIAAQALNRALCAAYALPLEVPRAPDGSIVTNMLTTGQAEHFRGVLGHYHLDPVKPDPGVALLAAIVRPLGPLPLGVA